MADADISNSYKPAVIVVDAESAITLDKRRQYRLQHLGLDADGSTAGTETIFLRADTATVDTDLSQSTDKAALVHGKDDITIGPGVSTLYANVSAGAPTFLIMPQVSTLGNY